jgi:hypothetical protein
MPGFPAVLNATTSADTATQFAFKTRTNTNGKFGGGGVVGTATAVTPSTGFSFGAPASNAASGTGGFAFSATATPAAPSVPNASSASFVFGGQGGSEQKSGFGFATPNQVNKTGGIVGLLYIFTHVTLCIENSLT